MPHYSCIHASNFPASPARHVSIRLSVLRAHGIYSLEDLYTHIGAMESKALLACVGW